MILSCLLVMTLILKQEVSISRMKLYLNFLTLLFIVLSVPQEVFAAESSSFFQEKMDLNLRWNFYALKDNLLFDKKGQSLYIKSLNSDIFGEFVEGLKKVRPNNKYISNILVHKSKDHGMITSIEVKLKGPEVETFSFYRDREKKYVLDFWIDESIAEAQRALEVKKLPASVQVPTPIPPKLTKKKVVKVTRKPTEVKKVIEKKSVKKKIKEKEFRDFRYGASFVWDYPALLPSLEKSIDILSKTPEHFYPIKNRKLNSGDAKKDEQEAHLQLSINLFRQKKFGLMYKSIKLYYQKYGEKVDFELNEYLKANAILRTGLSDAGNEPKKMAFAILDKLAAETTNYELSRSILKYLIAIKQEQGEWVDVLKKAKTLYVLSKKNFDYETSGQMGEVIFHSLSFVGQIAKIDDLKNDKTIKKLVAKQKVLAYEIYSLMTLKKTKEVIRRFNEDKKGMDGDYLPSILYNVAEAYFQMGDYKNAGKYFDSFIGRFSYHINSQRARLRLALSYELLNYPFTQTQELYKQAIDRTNQFDVSYEARLRYVGMRNLRKIKFDEEDELVRVFLANEKKIKLNKDLKKLLWLTKLRLLIVDEKFEDALAYLSAIPLETMTSTERRVFQADGAEIIYGVLLHNFQKRDFTRIIKVWEIYKDVYIDKVAGDPYINFIVGKAFIEMGLFDGYNRAYKKFKTLRDGPKRTYPLWVSRPKGIKGEHLIVELNLIKNVKQNNWVELKTNIEKSEKMNSNNNRVNFYKGFLAYENKNYQESIKFFESYLAQQEEKRVEDGYELAEILRKYTNSLYYVGNLERYKKVGEAILNDLKGLSSDNLYIKEVKEKISYTMIEVLSGDKKQKSYLLVEPKVKEFKKNFPESEYIKRLDYLRGLAFVETNQLEKGRKIFNEILGMEDAPNHLKDLVKSELSLLKIKEKTL